MNNNGSYHPKTAQITNINNIKTNGASIYNFELKDTLPGGHTMTGYFKVSGSSSGTILEENDKFTGDTGFTYKFDDAKFTTSNPDHEYTVTYKTKAPANFQIGDKVINYAELWLQNNKKWDASGEASYNDRGQTTEKKALNDTKLTESQATNKIFTLPWSLKVTPPIVWSNNRLEIADTIKDPPWVTPGTSQNNSHYAILEDLHTDA